MLISTIRVKKRPLHIVFRIYNNLIIDLRYEIG